MKLVLLGTSCSNPTKDRNLSSTALKYSGMWMLFDCPEGTQRQILSTDVSYMKIKYIFLSHFHADHILGIPGLVATMSIHDRDTPLTIFGPRGVENVVSDLIRMGLAKPSFEVRAKEVRTGTIVKEEEFEVSAFPLKHDVPCYGYVFREKDKEGEFMREKAEKKLGIPPGPHYKNLVAGKSIKWKGKTIKPEQVMDYSKAVKGRKVSVVMDTLPSESYLEHIAESDVLVHEASFIEKHITRARETKHSTGKGAAGIAERARVKKLVLTHISPRYKKADVLENEARQEFGNVVVGKDLLEIQIKRVN